MVVDAADTCSDCPPRGLVAAELAAEDEPWSGRTAWLADVVLADVGEVGAVETGLLPLVPGFLGAARAGGGGRALAEADVGEVTAEAISDCVEAGDRPTGGVKPGTIVLKAPTPPPPNNPPPTPPICGKNPPPPPP